MLFSNKQCLFRIFDGVICYDCFNLPLVDINVSCILSMITFKKIFFFQQLYCEAYTWCNSLYYGYNLYLVGIINHMLISCGLSIILDVIHRECLMLLSMLWLMQYCGSWYHLCFMYFINNICLFIGRGNYIHEGYSMIVT